MKLIFVLALFSSFSLQAEIVAQITHFSGDVYVNGQKIQKKTTLLPRYKIEIKPSVADGDNSKESFAYISFKSGHRLLVKSGKMVVENLGLDVSEISVDQSEILMMVESPDKRHFLPALKIHSRHGSFLVYGGKIRMSENFDQMGLDVAQGKVLINSAWGSQEIYSEQGAAVNHAKILESGGLGPQRIGWLNRQFRTMGLR